MQVADKNREAKGIALLAVVCAVLQLALVPNVGLGLGRANLALVFAALVALRFGGRAGVLAGFFAGLFFDLSTTGPVGLMAFCLSVVGFALGREERDRMAEGMSGSLVSFAAAALLVSLVYHLAMLLVGQGDSLLDAIVFRTLPTALLSIVAFVPFAWFFSRTRPSSSGFATPHHGRGGHFSRRGL